MQISCILLAVLVVCVHDCLSQYNNNNNHGNNNNNHGNNHNNHGNNHNSHENNHNNHGNKHNNHENKHSKHGKKHGNNNNMHGNNHNSHGNNNNVYGNNRGYSGGGGGGIGNYQGFAFNNGFFPGGIGGAGGFGGVTGLGGLAGFNGFGGTGLLGAGLGFGGKRDVAGDEPVSNEVTEVSNSTGENDPQTPEVLDSPEVSQAHGRIWRLSDCEMATIQSTTIRTVCVGAENCPGFKARLLCLQATDVCCVKALVDLP